MSTLSFSTVGCPWAESSIAPPADKLIAVVLLSEKLQRWLDDTASQPKNEMKSGFFLDVVIRQSPSIFKLLASKDEELFIQI